MKHRSIIKHLGEKDGRTELNGELAPKRTKKIPSPGKVKTLIVLEIHIASDQGIY